MKGWYSLVQYCPDASRAEVANVGLVLLCPEAQFIDVRMSSGNDGPRRIFKVEGDELDDLKAAKRAFVHRIFSGQNLCLNLESFVEFQKTRGNDLILTDPRLVRVDEPTITIAELFEELVGGRAMGEAISRERGFSARTSIRSLFDQEEFAGLIEERVEIPVPNLPRPFKADYQFHNGKPNLITIPVVRRDVDETISRAMKSIVGADILQRHEEAKVIVALPDRRPEVSDSLSKLSNLYGEYNIRQVHEAELEEFGREVLAVAH